MISAFVFFVCFIMPDMVYYKIMLRFAVDMFEDKGEEISNYDHVSSIHITIIIIYTKIYSWSDLDNNHFILIWQL